MLINYGKIIRESLKDFGFVDKIPELHGVTFKTNSDNIIYKIEDIGFRVYVTILWENPHTKKMEEAAYKRTTVHRLFNQGVWVITDDF